MPWWLAPAVAWALVAPAVLVSPMAPRLAALPPEAAGTTSSPTEVLDAAMSAAAHQSSVSWTTKVNFQHPAQVGTKSVYIGPDGATQAETERDANSSLRDNFLYSSGRLYVNASSAGLLAAAGFRPTAARQEAGKWLATGAASVTAREEFPQMLHSFTLSSVWSSWFLLGATLRMLPSTTVDGRAVARVEEMAHTPAGTVTEMVYIGTGHLPLRVTTAVPGRYPQHTIIDYSGWGRVRPVTTPTRFAPIQAAWLDASWPGRSAPRVPEPMPAPH